MAYNYTQYVNDLANLLVVSSNDPNFLIVLPNIIDDAEQRIYRELDLLTTITSDSTGALTANNRGFTFPQHFVVCEQLNVFTPVSTTANRYQLVPVSREWIDAVYPNSAATSSPSVPQYYAMVTDQTVLVGPPPDANYTIQVVGTIRPVPLSSANTTTYLTQYLPDLFMAASLTFSSGYLQNYGAMVDNPGQAVSWEGHYQALKGSADIEEARKKYAAMGWTPKQPIATSTPPRV